MISGVEPKKVTIIQFGPLNRTELLIAIDLANQTQTAFLFEVYPRRFPVSNSKYLLPNGGYDLERAAIDLQKRFRFPKPCVFVTDLPYSDLDVGTQEQFFFFMDLSIERDLSVGIISTHLWRQLGESRRLQPYILYSLAVYAFSEALGLPVHDETTGCLFDYCDDPEDIDKSLKGSGLCGQYCMPRLNQKIRGTQAPLVEIASGFRLFNRAVGKRQCFIAMPYHPQSRSVYVRLEQVLRKRKWFVVRADEVEHPRTISNAIWLHVLISDLVIADLSGNNPNVFYELGMAHALGKDVILITQESELPIDVKLERAITYSPKALNRLEKGLEALLGKD